MNLTQPRTFEELMKNIDLYKASTQCMRLPSDQEYYEVQSKNIEVKDRVDSIRATVKNIGWDFTPNNFPYTWLLEFLPDVEHSIFWTDGDPDNFKELLDMLEAKKLKYCYFENRPIRRSIPDLTHYQIFIQDKGL